MACEDQINTEDLINAKTDSITLGEVATSRAGAVEGGAPITTATNRFGDVADTVQGRLNKLGVIFDDPIRDWSPSFLINDLRAHRYPAGTGDIYIPTKALPFTTGSTFNVNDWELYQLQNILTQINDNTQNTSDNTQDINDNTQDIAENTLKNSEQDADILNIQSGKENIGVSSDLVSSHNNNSGSHPSILASISALQDSQTGGSIVFQTYAELTSFTPLTVDEERTSYKVANDPVASLNGFYSWVSGTTYIKDAELNVVNVIDRLNIDEGASGAAVYYHHDTDFESINAIDFSDVTVGFFIAASGTGSLEPTQSGDDVVSPLIYIKDATTAAVSSVRQMSSPFGVYFYAEDRTWLSTEQPETIAAASGTPGYINVPGNAFYMRYTLGTIETDHTCTLNDVLPHPFIPYDRNINQDVLPEPEVSEEDVSRLTEFANVFDKSAADLGFYINSSGVIITELGNFDYISDYMPINEGQELICNTSFRVPTGAYGFNMYDKYKRLIHTAQQVTLLFVGVADAAFIRLTVDASSVDAAQANYGNALDEYSDHREEFSRELLWRVYGEGFVDYGPAFYNKSALRETKKRLQNLSLGLFSDSLSIAMIGDSWTHASEWYSLNVCNILKAKYQDSGLGYVGFGWVPYGDGLPRPSGLNGNIDPSKVDVALYGAWSHLYATEPCPDISAAYTDTPGDNIIITVDEAVDVITLYAVGSGTVSYSIDGGSATNIVINNSTLTYTIPAQGSAFNITLTNVSGTLTLQGLMFKNNSDGVNVSKLGVTGSKLQEWAVQAVEADFVTTLGRLESDLITVLHGTNDQNANRTKSQFKSDCITLVDAIISARPTADILLITPPENGSGSSVPMSDYAEAMREVAYLYNIAHLNLQNYFGEFYSDYGFGSDRGWFRSDEIHPTTEGGAIVNTSAIVNMID